jgi:hypothetical protein
MFSRICGLFLAVLVVGGGGAFAQDATPGLQWDETLLKIETEGGMGPKDVTFRFRNTGTRPVVIRSVSTSCGCTVTKTDKNEYAPGESGVLPVTHKPKPGPGVRNYRINVMTDEGGGRHHMLTLQVANSPRLTILPRVLTWEQGEARSPKNIDVRVKKDDPIKLTGARADKDVLDLQIREGAEPGSSTVVVTPKAGTGVVPGRVRVQLLTEPPMLPSMDNQFFVVLR